MYISWPGVGFEPTTTEFHRCPNRLSLSFRNAIIMDILCGDCDATYYSKLQIYDHLGISYLTGEKMKIESNNKQSKNTI